MDVSIRATYAYVFQACRKGIIIDLLSPLPRARQSLFSSKKGEKPKGRPLFASDLTRDEPTLLSVSPDIRSLPSLCARPLNLPFGDGIAEAVLLGTELWLSVDVNKALGEARRVLSKVGLLAVLVANPDETATSHSRSIRRNESTWWEPDVEEVGALLKQHFPYVATMTVAENSGCTLRDVRDDAKSELLVSVPATHDRSRGATHVLFVATRRSRKLPGGLNLMIRRGADRTLGDVGEWFDMLSPKASRGAPKALVSAVDEGAILRMSEEIGLLKSTHRDIEEQLRYTQASLESQSRQLGSLESTKAKLEVELKRTTEELEEELARTTEELEYKLVRREGELELTEESLEQLRKEIEEESKLRQQVEGEGRELEAALTIAERRAIQTEVRCRRLRQESEELQGSLEQSEAKAQRSQEELLRNTPLWERDRCRALRIEAVQERLEKALARERSKAEAAEEKLGHALEALAQEREESDEVDDERSRLERALAMEIEKRQAAESKIADLVEARAISQGSAENASEELNAALRKSDDLIEEVAALRIELDDTREEADLVRLELTKHLGAEQIRRASTSQLPTEDVISALSNSRDLRSSLLRLIQLAHTMSQRRDDA